jgi:heme/copper-type cytochrome/quinol oxidase subunit 2
VINQTPQKKQPVHGWQWAILPILGLLVFFVPLPARATAPADRIIHINARRFEYDPAILKVNQGDRVTIELVATDVVHGLAIDGYNLETTADPGKPARLTFVADQAGTFRFRCTVTCGNMHPFMTGKLEVGQNSLLWRAIAFTGLGLVTAVWMGRK